MNRLALVTTIAGLLVAGPSLAQMGGGMGGGGGGEPPPRVMPDVDDESIIMMIPERWNPYGREEEGKTDAYAFPTGQDPQNWRHALRLETFDTTAGMETAARVYELRTENDAKSCEDLSTEVMTDEPENGYSMIYWKQICDLGEDRVVSQLNKVILGEEQLFILSMIWKSDPPNRTWRRWEEYFEDIYVCDPTRPQEHRCLPLGFSPANPPQGGGMGRGAAP